MDHTCTFFTDPRGSKNICSLLPLPNDKRKHIPQYAMQDAINEYVDDIINAIPLYKLAILRPYFYC